MVEADELQLGTYFIRVIDEASGWWRWLLCEGVSDCFYFVGASEERCWLVSCCAAHDEGNASQLDCRIIVSLEDGGTGDSYFGVFGIIDNEGVFFKISCITRLDHGDKTE